MGGASPAEFNAAADRAALDEVLGAAIDVAVVPIEITRQVTLDDAVLRRWATGTIVSRFCAQLAACRRPRPGAPTVTVHDPVAVIAALEPRLFDWSPRRLTPRGREVRLAVGVDVTAVHERIVAAVEATGTR
jgi:inosine-uridine nucleoside N-ribohydrolase